MDPAMIKKIQDKNREQENAQERRIPLHQDVPKPADKPKTTENSKKQPSGPIELSLV